MLAILCVLYEGERARDTLLNVIFRHFLKSDASNGPNMYGLPFDI